MQSIIKRCFCLTSVCLSVAYIGLNSRTARPRKTTVDTEVAHVTRDSDTTFRVKGQLVADVKILSSCRGRRHIVSPRAQLVIGAVRRTSPVTDLMKKVLGRFSQSSLERWHAGDGKTTTGFWWNLDLHPNPGIKKVVFATLWVRMGGFCLMNFISVYSSKTKLSRRNKSTGDKPNQSNGVSMSPFETFLLQITSY